jgi:hypothetical protein
LYSLIKEIPDDAYLLARSISTIGSSINAVLFIE